MHSGIVKIQEQIEPLRQEIIHHHVYNEIEDLESLRVFMEFHVYAVWDFMSLLKALQQGLTCTTTPWFPVGNPNTRYLINEIVTGEESDIDHQGVRKSHFELYLEAMDQCQANTAPIKTFLSHLQAGHSLEEACQIAVVPLPAREFMKFTFDLIDSREYPLQSAAFTFGREDLIPNMFISIVADLNQKFPDQLGILKYYMERHIEVDGDHHSNLALDMTAELCGENAEIWSKAQQVTIDALQQRVKLWDGVYDSIKEIRSDKAQIL